MTQGPISSVTSRKIETMEPAVGTIDWDDLKLLLRAAQNPRFCVSVDDAKAFFAGKRPGDSIAMIAAFPYIVYEPLPEAPDVTPTQRKALGTYPINTNVAKLNKTFFSQGK
jgi:hypothetical protein